MATRTHVAFPLRRVSRDVVAAREEARALVEAGGRRASELVLAATAEAARLRAVAAEEGRVEGLGHAAALALSLRERESRADEAALDRTLSLAALLAERLIGAVIAEREDALRMLAKVALEEARGARRVVIRVHPEDAPRLGAATASFDPEARVHAVVPDAALGRGDLVLETEVGVVDARLGASLERLAVRLREALRQ